eukprot:gene12239-14962_t
MGECLFMTPLFLLNHNTLNGTIRHQQISSKDYLILGTMIGGMLLEIVADYQKSNFKNKSKNEDKFINCGLWKIVQHPNYAAEIIIHWSFFVFAIGSYQSPFDQDLNKVLISFISPVLTTFYFIRVGGPILVESSLKKYDSPAFRQYLKSTKRFIPYVF